MPDDLRCIATSQLGHRRGLATGVLVERTVGEHIHHRYGVIDSERFQSEAPGLH